MEVIAGCTGFLSSIAKLNTLNRSILRRLLIFTHCTPLHCCKKSTGHFILVCTNRQTTVTLTTCVLDILRLATCNNCRLRWCLVNMKEYEQEQSAVHLALQIHGVISEAPGNTIIEVILQCYPSTLSYSLNLSTL